MKKIIILGCTGSIGSTTLQLLREEKDNSFEVVGLSAGKRTAELQALAKEFNCKNIASPYLEKAKGVYNTSKELLENTEADIVLNGLSGATGLEGSFYALTTQKDLALANKESVVMAYDLLVKVAKENNRRIVPVDSEHSAIYELIKAHKKENVKKVIITASGGPFRKLTRDELGLITPMQAVKHPTWNMGPKISIDSSTLANKALEVIEAARLFGMRSDQIQTVIHPQSIVHSMVVTSEGQTYAQLSFPTMRFPIKNSIYELANYDFKSFTNTPLFEVMEKEIALEFYKMDFQRFPFVKMGFDSIDLGSSATIAFNAANEVAVDLFMKNKLSFNKLEDVVAKTLYGYDWKARANSLDEVMKIDLEARNRTHA